jgi:hypothetical protein
MYDKQTLLADTDSIQIQPTLVYLVLRVFLKRNRPTITSSSGNLNYYRFTLLLALKGQAASILAETMNLKIISNVFK